MSIYLVALVEKNDQAIEKIKKVWPDKYCRVSDTMYMVAAKTTTTDHIADQVGIDVGEEKASGFVIELPLNTHGVFNASAVQWYNNIRDSK